MSFPRFNRGRSRRSGDQLPDALAALGQTPGAPDFSASILNRVNAQRPFFETPAQTAIRWTKIVTGALATGLAVLAGAAVWYAPEILPWQADPRPISAVVHSAVGDAKAGMNRLEALRRSVESLASRDTDRAPRQGWVDEKVSAPLVRVASVTGAERGLAMLPLRAMFASPEPRAIAHAKLETLPHAGELPAAWIDSGGGSESAAPAPMGWDGSGVTPQ